MKSPKEIGETIRELRGKESLRDFALKCDISHTALDAIECGINKRSGKPTNPSAVTLEKIANAARVPLSFLIESDNQDKKSIFAERLKIALNNKNMKQSVLAYHLGVDRSYISNYLSGKYSARPEIIVKMAKILNVSEAWLIGFDEPMEQESTTTSVSKPMKDTLKQLRQNKGYSQKELGSILGISPSAIGMYETGARTPDHEILQKYSELFDVDYNFLYGASKKANLSDCETLGDIEQELLRICDNLDMRKKNILLTKAYELLDS